MIKFSIIIGVRSRVDNLKNSIRSILNQKFEKKFLEIIIVNYGGSDDIKKIVDSFNKNLVKYVYVPDEGSWNEARAKNIGIRHANGEIIGCINADIILARNVLDKVYNHYKNNKKSYLYQIQRRDFIGNNLKKSKLLPVGYAQGDFQASYRDNWYKVRGFDERMVGWGWIDNDLSVRMDRIGVKQFWMPKNVKMYHQHHQETPRNENDFNMFKSKLNLSYKANDRNWGSVKKKEYSFYSKIFHIINLELIYFLFKIVRFFKRILRKIS